MTAKIPSPRRAGIPLIAALVPAWWCPAATVTWDRGDGNSDWSAGANWSGVPDDSEPNINDDAVFPTPIPANDSIIDLSSGEAANSLSFLDSYTLNGGSLTLGSGTASTDSGVTAQINSALSGTSGLTKVGAGTLILSASNSFAGDVTVSAGTLRMQHADALGVGTSAVTVSGTLDVDEVTLNRAVTMNTSALLRGRGSSGATGTITVASGADINILAIIGSGIPQPLGVLTLGSLTGGGPGSSITVGLGRILPQPSTYIGDWSITGGTVEIDSDDELGNSANTVSLSTGGRLATTGTFSSARNFTMGAGSGGRIDAAGKLTLTTGLVANANPFTAGGAGTLELISASSRTGTSTIINGVLSMVSPSALGSGMVNVNSGGVLELATNGVFSMPLHLGHLSTLRVQGATAPQYAGAITAADSAGSLTLDTPGGGLLTLSAYAGGVGSNTIVSGSGLVLMSNPNTYAGSWQINGGRLRPGSAAALGAGASAIQVNNNGILELTSMTLARPVTLSNSATLRTFNATANTTEPLTIASGATVTLGGTSTTSLTIGDSPNDLTGGGDGSFITVITSALTGKVILSQPSDYIGDWRINLNATLEIDGDDRLGNAANPVSILGGRLRATGTFSAARPLQSTNFGRIDVTMGNVLTLTGGLGGGTGASFIKEGAGMLVLSANGARSGSTTVEGGTLRLEDPGAAGSGSMGVSNLATLELDDISVGNTISLFNGSTLRGIGAASTTSFFSVSGSTSNVTLATGTGAGDVLTLGGTSAIGGGGASASITVAGSGTVAIASSSTYTGGWTLSSGTLQIAADNRLGNLANSLTFDGGTLLTSAAVTSARNITVDAGGGTIITNGFDSIFGNVAGPGTLVKNTVGKLTANHVRTEGLTINTGTVAIASNGGASGVSRVSALTIGASAKLDLNDNDLIVDGGNYAALEAAVISGRAGGAWNGAGIHSSTAAANASLLSLGIARADDLNLTSYGGFTDLNEDEIIVKHTYVGDANLSGQVNLDDFNLFLDGLDGSPTASWLFGDFNYSGSVNLDDFNLFLFGLANQAPGGLVSPELFAALAEFSSSQEIDVDLSAVPEPSVLYATGVMGLLFRRRRSV